MNQDASQNPANNPAPSANLTANTPAYPNAPAASPAPPAAPAGGGLKSVLKIAAPLALLVGVVFAITYFSRYTPVEPEIKTKEVSDPPLRIFESERGLDPPNLSGEYRDFPLSAPSADPKKVDDPFGFSLRNRIFQVYYESDGQERTARFWFENRRPNSVTMQLTWVSCTACSGGRVASIPPDVTRQILQQAAVGTLPMGPFNGLPVGMAGPAAQLTKLEWTEHKFAAPGGAGFNPNAIYHVQPANPSADKWSPQWGILELQFKVNKSDRLEAHFGTRVDNTEIAALNKFAITFAAAPAFEVWPPTLDLGRLDDLSGDL